MGESTKTSSIFKHHQIERLQRIGRFIIHVCDPDIVEDVLKLGFDSNELAEGQKDYSVAMGLSIPLDHHISSAVYEGMKSGGADTNAKISAVDRFENRWMPRTRNAIRRFVAADQREAFLEAFFRDLKQQPEGPLAVDSARKLVARLKELGASTVPGAKEAHASLLKKGLKTELDLVVLLLKDLDTQPAVKMPPAPVPEEAIATLAQQRTEAYERLNLWYTDWAQVFRDDLTYHQLLRLGLVSIGGAALEEEQPEEPAPTE